MKQILLFLLLCSCTLAFSQHADTGQKPRIKGKLLMDSASVIKLRQSIDSAISSGAYTDSAVIKDNYTQDFDAILDFQKKQKEKQRKTAILRIAIGVGFLVLLVFGLSRRRKKV